MNPSPSAINSPPFARDTGVGKLSHLPAEVQEAFRLFQANGDLAALDRVILAILTDMSPHFAGRPLEKMPADTRLIDDLGFDSLAITEVVFFTEDLLGINITNEEIIQVRTLHDLQGFVRRKVGAYSAG